MIDKALPIRLEQERKRHKMTKKALANEIFISERAYGAIAKGESDPRLETMISLSKSLDCSLDYLVGSSDYRTMEEITGIDDRGIEALRKINRLRPEEIKLLSRMASSGALDKLLNVILTYAMMCDTSSMTLTNEVYNSNPLVLDGCETRTQLRTSAMFDFGNLLDDISELYAGDRKQAAEDREAIFRSELKILELEKQIAEMKKKPD